MSRVRVFAALLYLLSFEGFSEAQEAVYGKNPSMEGVRIEQASTSRKSVVLDRGSMEGIRVGQVAKLYYQSSRDKNKPQYTYIAEGEAIKVHRNYSFWFLRKIRHYRLIKEGSLLVILRQMMDARRPYVNRHTQKVLTKNQSKRELRTQEEKGVPRDLILKEKDYLDSSELVSTTPLRHQDMETETLTRWKRVGTNEFDEKYKAEKPIFFVEPAIKPKTIKSIKVDREKEVWRSTTQSSIDKVNKLPFGLEGYYADSFHNPETGVKVKADAVSIYDRELEKKSQDNLISPGAIKKIETEGLTFSADMDDEQLRRFFINSGIAEEVERQKRALFEKSGSEINFGYHSALSSHTTNEDKNYQGTDYSLSLGYEYHLGNASALLSRLSLEGSLETGLGFYDLGGINARFAESSFRVYSYFYFLYPPNSLNRLMPYLGLGFRRGKASVYSPNFSKGTKEYTYLLVAFPSYRLGVKYRFQSGDSKNEVVKFGLGLNFQIQYESVSINSKDVLQDNIFGKLDLDQLRLGFGISAYF